MYAKEFLGSNKIKKFCIPFEIRDALKDYKEDIKKVFPKIGLNNCKEKISKYNKNYQFNWIEIKKDVIKWINNVDNNIDILDEKYKNITYISLILKTIVKNDNDILTFNIKDPFGNILLKKGTSKINIVKSINDIVIKHKYIKIIDNYVSDKSKIVFSSDGIDGIWDILTMSMRGIDSCQRWNSNHHCALTGSVLDPFTGIIYITNEKNTKFGENMVARSIVRFVFKKYYTKPLILIEKPYNYINDDRDSVLNYIMNIFINFISEKTKNKFSIIYNDKKINNKYLKISDFYIPKSKSIDFLEKNFGKDYLSYRDSGIQYSLLNKKSKYSF